HPLSLALDHHPPIHPGPTALALDHLAVDAHRVPGLEPRDPVAKLFALELLDDLAHEKKGSAAARNGSRRLHEPDARRRPVDREELADDVLFRQWALDGGVIGA